MLSRQAFWRNSCAAATLGLALAGLNSAANATLPDYLATTVMLPLPPFPLPPFGLQADVRAQPVVLLAAAETAPAGATGAPAAAAPSPAMTVNPPLSQDPDSLFPNLGSSLRAFSDPTAPAWQFGAHIGLDEILTDNVAHSATDHRSDVITQLIAGISLTGATPRLQAVLNYSAILRRALSGSQASGQQNRLSNYGTSTAHLTIVPDLFYFNMAANAHDIVRDGSGAPNPALLTNSQATQIYTLSAMPTMQTRVGTVGFLSARYSYSELWRDGNTGPIATPSGNLAAFSGATSQQAQAQFQMPGAFDARMLNEFAVRASETLSGKIGTLRKAGGDFITEYQLTRSLSAIGDAGYESISAPNVPPANGQGPTWNIGGRWRPNIDSSFLLLYGRHDLKTDASGEIAWRITPLTSFYASYTNSLTSSQRTLLGNNEATQLGDDGPSLGVTFEDDPVIAILGDTNLTGDLSGQNGGSGGAFPFLEGDNLILATKRSFPA